MLRSTDIRSGAGETALLLETLARGERLLCHAELISVELPSPPGSLTSLMNVGSVVGQLVITGVDETAVRLRWEDPYTVSPSEDARDLLTDEDAVLIVAAIETPGGVEIEDFFARLGWMQDLVDGRKLIIEHAEIKLFEWSGSEQTPVDDPATPAAELVQGIEAWFRSVGFADNEFPTNYIRAIDESTGLTAAVAPQSFLMENMSRRHPVTVQLGIARRDLNEFSDWFSGRPHRPWRWTLHERTNFFNPSAQLAWPADTPLEQAIAEIEPALEAAAGLADDDRLANYLRRDESIHIAFHRKHRITHEMLRGWGDRGEAELAAWKEVTVSQNQTQLFESTLRKYLETGEPAYWISS